MTEEKLRRHLGEGLLVTDCTLKYSKSGSFRRFGFVGFKTEDDANAVIKKFDKSYINTTQISVEIAKNILEVDKVRPWSKYSKEKLRAEELKKEVSGSGENVVGQNEKKSKAKAKQDNLTEQLFGELMNDTEFQEFLDLHKARDQKTTWSNDITAVTDPGKNQHESDSSSDDDSVAGEKAETATESSAEQTMEQTKGSDLDYLRSKVGQNEALLGGDSDDDSSAPSSSDEADEEDVTASNKTKLLKSEKTDKDTDISDVAVFDNEETTKYLIKINGVPVSVNEHQIREFFKPLEPVAVRIPRKAKGVKSTCVATVEFSNEDDQNKALQRNKSFIGPKRVFLHKIQVVDKVEAPQIKPSWEDKVYDSVRDGEEETIAESGRLYVRNLAYCCTEDDLQACFSKYGLLTEVLLPIDRMTKRIKGYAFVTFMMPEHAIKAFTELNGTMFQGRTMHILPGRSPPNKNAMDPEKMSFKQKQEHQKKLQSSSSHNWNSLFLGANAVADVMAEKYDAKKSDILDPTEKQSLGVRMALGETQIVSETREFLTDNGVVLDSFSQPGAARSKTVILVKNLPAATSTNDITDLFVHFGTLGRVLLPPSGVTAIVEFLQPTEARTAFRALAYSKFKHLPLYLEWAPAEVFRSASAVPDYRPAAAVAAMDGGGDQEEDKDSTESPEADVIVQSGCTLFVKNLNFETTDETLKEVFSRCGKITSASIAKKKDIKHPGKLLSMGYGFVIFTDKASADKAIKTLQHKDIDGHAVELKLSTKDTVSKTLAERKRRKQVTGKKPSTKIAIRNIPFEAHVKEIRELFSVFGELKFCRLPKKLSTSGGTHRGFGFVEFLTKDDAKRAFETLCHSTHLYGRRLVLEWAAADDDVDALREKTAKHFEDEPKHKKLKKSELTENLLRTA